MLFPKVTLKYENFREFNELIQHIEGIVKRIDYDRFAQLKIVHRKQSAKHEDIVTKTLKN